MTRCAGSRRWAGPPAQWDAHDPAALNSALALSARSRKPTLIACRTMLGRSWRAPAACPDSATRWAVVGHGGSTARRAWLKRLTHHPQRAEFERVMAERRPENWVDALAAFKAEIAADRRPASTRDSAERLLEALAPGFPELVGGQTELGAKRGAPVTPGSFSGRQVHYGPREHGMAACLNGLALHGGLLPYAVAPLASTDSMRPALRLSAMMGLRAIYVATHDSIGLGADGAAYQPVEQLASLRALPNLLVLRPADAVEAAECCELAVRRSDGPSMLVLSEQPVPALRSDVGENRSARGAYVLAEANGPRAATLIASGSEVALALAAREKLAAEGLAVAVVSMPAWSLFARADAGVQAAVLGAAPPLRHRGRLRLRVGALAGGGRCVHGSVRLRRICPGRQPVPAFRIDDGGCHGGRQTAANKDLVTPSAIVARRPMFGRDWQTPRASASDRGVEQSYWTDSLADTFAATIATAFGATFIQNRPTWWWRISASGSNSCHPPRWWVCGRRCRRPRLDASWAGGHLQPGVRRASQAQHRGPETAP